MTATSARPDNVATKPRRAAAAAGTHDQDWRAQAACRGAANLFYQPDLELKPATDHRLSRAKAVCARCSVRPQCAAYALRVAEPHGVWGGFTERGRMLLRDSGWLQHANRLGTWVDVSRLESELREIKALERQD